MNARTSSVMKIRMIEVQSSLLVAALKDILKDETACDHQEDLGKDYS
jgi:hypothetical protein